MHDVELVDVALNVALVESGREGEVFIINIYPHTVNPRVVLVHLYLHLHLHGLMTTAVFLSRGVLLPELPDNRV